MARRMRGGFTLIEILVVIAIIGILAALLLPALSAARCHAKEGTAKAMIRDMETALKAYESDFGIFPGDASWGTGTASLVTAMANPGPRNMPYYEFKPASLNGNGEWRSPVSAAPDSEGDVFFYSPPPPRNTHTAQKQYSPDLWGFDCDARTDASQPPTRVNNWQ